LDSASFFFLYLVWGFQNAANADEGNLFFGDQKYSAAPCLRKKSAGRDGSIPDVSVTKYFFQK
jgi:hypothetical protein